MKYSLVVCGGTFDHFHKGHKVFLTKVFSSGGRFIIGVMSDEYVRKLKIKNEKLKITEDFEKRKSSVWEFIKSKNKIDKCKIVEISDVFGQTLDRGLKIDAIVVSSDTQKGAEIINRKREEKGLKKLEVVAAPDVLAEDGKMISSSRIRNGEIDRDGKLYVKPSWLEQTLVLPKDLRSKLRNPLGSLLNFNVSKDYSQLRNKLVVTVGDVTTKKFNDLGLKQKISVIDFRVKRENKFSSTKELGFEGDEKSIIVDNPAGSITANLFTSIVEIFENKHKIGIILQIKGEEDLAVLPVVLRAPLGALVFYGQPDKGLVRVEVTEESKRKVYGLVSQFKPCK